ncbi:signal peptide protein [Rhodopirellula sp. SWK7]|nr:signal peptide protein [Rhodopirellula sp. SWK7]
MVPSIRPLTTFLLSVMLALGHAPAWLHVASCDHDVCSHRDCGHGGCEHGESILVASHHHAGCCHSHGADDWHQSASDHDAFAEIVLSPNSNSSPHESHACWICQSLASPVGLVNGGGFHVESTNAIVLEFPRCDSADVEPSHTLPPLRGPPAISV